MDVDPVDLLTRRVEDLVRELDAWRHEELLNRLALLACHAVIGVVVGGLMLKDGTAQAAHSLFGEQAEILVGGVALVGGGLLGAGLLLKPRPLVLELLGLGTLSVWHLGMAWTFLAYLLKDDPAATDLSYPVAIYSGYLLLLGVHLWTLYRRWRRHETLGFM